MVFGRIDVTLNDLEDFIGEYPTLKLYKLGLKDKPLTHSGPRKAEDIIEFL